MGRICVLTDNSAQFPTATFPGHRLVHVIPQHVKIEGLDDAVGSEIKAHDLPASAGLNLDPIVSPPTVEEFTTVFQQLGARYDEIIVLLISSQLIRAVERAEEAASTLRGRLGIHVIDTHSTSVGLGLLTQAAAAAAAEGLSGIEIERQIRGLIPHIYAIFCVPGLTYLHHAGLLNPAQALVGEKLGVMPLFVLERGQLIATQKARSSRHLVDCLHEFVGEFNALDHIAIVQGVPPFEQEVRSLRERFGLDFEEIPISEHIIGPGLASLLGPQTLGLFVREREI